MRACKAQITVGDSGSYLNVVESLRSLCSSVRPKSLPSRQRKNGRLLKHILKGVYSRVTVLVRRGTKGIANLLHTEISGLGGLSIFRRMDATILSSDKAESGSAQSVGPRRQFSAPRGGRGRGAPRGGGSGRRDASQLTCYGCFRIGHKRSECPEADLSATPSKSK